MSDQLTLSWVPFFVSTEHREQELVRAIMDQFEDVGIPNNILEAYERFGYEAEDDEFVQSVLRENIAAAAVFACQLLDEDNFSCAIKFPMMPCSMLVCEEIDHNMLEDDPDPDQTVFMAACYLNDMPRIVHMLMLRWAIEDDGKYSNIS